MKIGIFDSGLGGLLIAKAIRKAMPQYDYVYLGDTKRVPYGNRSHQIVFEYTKEAVEYLFKKEDCAIIIIACNTSSARALRRVQMEYLKDYNKSRAVLREEKRNVLGVLIPTAEECASFENIGVLATRGTVESDAFSREIKKINRKSKVYQSPAPMLVPLIEEGENKLAQVFIKKYLEPFKNKKIEAIVLGCTHYPMLKKEIKIEAKKILGRNVKLISQDEIVPAKLKNYFDRHPEIERMLLKRKIGEIKILVTDKTKKVEELSQKWFGKTKPELVNL